MSELEKGFITFYREYEELFGEKCKKLEGANVSFNWPKGSGVYVVWNGKPNLPANIIYIGMTGKFSRNTDNTILFNGQQFIDQMLRWTPYRFCESLRDGEYRYSLRFGPKYSGVAEQGKHKYDPNAYRHNIPYRNLHIDCFIINNDHPTLTPIAFKTILLTKYLKEFGDLPPANNSL